MIKKFDKEYSTQYVPEMKYIQSKGIEYSFVKDVQGVTTYKYTKTPELFKKEKQSELFQEDQNIDSLLLCSNE